MNFIKSCRTLARLAVIGGMFLFATSGYSFDGIVSGAMATASANGDGGGIGIEAWFILMLALLGAAQWLDHKDANLAERRVRVVHDHLDFRQTPR